MKPTPPSTINNNHHSPAASTTASTSTNPPPHGVGGGLKPFFKTPEGRYNRLHDKSHPSNPPLPLSKSITQITLARLNDQAAQSTAAVEPSQPSSSYSVASSGIRYVTSRFFGSGGGSSGSRVPGAFGGNGTSSCSKAAGGVIKSGTTGGLNFGSSAANFSSTNNSDDKGDYLIFNVGDTLYISNLTSEEKDPLKSIIFSNSIPVCHAFDYEAKDGHDLLIGLSSGDVYSVSLRQQLEDVGRKLVAAHHYNKDGSLNNSRCTSISWIPQCNGAFVAAHADGNLYVYEKNKDGSGDSTFPVIKDQTQFSVSHARSGKSNPIARWHICHGPINGLAFSTDGKYLAAVGRDGYLRVFDYANEQLIYGGKSYYGGLLCCAWSGDGKYILTGGEDDLVQVWSVEERKVVAWGEGHNSWVSGVSFDSYWSSPTSEDTLDNAVYRFGSVGQDAQLLLWDLAMDEIVVPLRRPPGGSPTASYGTQPPHWDNVTPVGALQPAPSTRDIPKLSPVVAHRLHSEPLSGLIFSRDLLLTASRDGHVKIWRRPGHSGDQVSGSEPLPSAVVKEKIPTINVCG